MVFSVGTPIFCSEGLCVTGAISRVPASVPPAIEVNIRAGYLPEPEANGVSYLTIPLNK